ncbi:DUF4240 domain-containing protein [Streptomyces sp. NPDC056468]|uniref:DUF4240 domain-containing protein n=1 Tax=Streptomyces sp. NPDC056468 TaxID=3345830 RepID=UPI0036CD4C61
MDFRAGVIALGCQWYQRVAADPDSLAAHPDVVQAANVRDRSEVLFYEDVNYAASGAFERITGDADAFYETWRSFRATDTECDNAVDMGEDFDFDDDREMSRRLPRLSALFLGTSPRKGFPPFRDAHGWVRMRARRSSTRSPAVHGSVECFHAVHVPFDRTGAPPGGESGGDRVEVLAKEAGKVFHGPSARPARPAGSTPATGIRAGDGPGRRTPKRDRRAG